MSDRQILERFNKIVAAEQKAASSRQHVAVEIPNGRPQIRYFAPANQWAPRGGVLRCVVDDSGPNGEAIIYIDDQPLTLAEFGRMLCTYSGWGMRITFVPEEELTAAPRVALGDPDD